MASNFYKDLLEHDFYEEKIASEHSNTMDILDSFSADQIEAIAEELGLLFEKEAEETTESRIVDSNKEENEPEEEKKEDVKEAEEENKEDIKEVEEKKEDVKEAEEENKEDIKEVEEKKEDVKEAEEENKESDSKEQILSLLQKKIEQNQQQQQEENKEAYEIEQEIIKMAYSIAEEKLASTGITVADYVFNKIANEDIALFVADKAEKLAYVSEKSPYQVADDIMYEIGSVLSNLEG